MRLSFPLLAGSLLVVLPAQAVVAQPAAELERALQGRVAGTPVDCLPLHSIRASRIISRTAIVYETRGGTLYVNRPRAGGQTLDKWDVLVTDTHGSQLCSVDIVRLYDPQAGMQTGFVGLGKFVPYRKHAQD